MQNIKIKPKPRISNDLILFIIYILTIIDYILTYYGVNVLGIISEANPLMINFMILPFNKGLFFRCIITFFPLVTIKAIEKKIKVLSTYRFIIVMLLTVQIIPFLLHLIWIYNYMLIFKINLHKSLY